MSYVEQTLTDGEVVEQFIKYHWFYVVYPIIMMSFCIIVMLIGFIGMLVVSGNSDDLLGFIAVVMFVSFIVAICYLFLLIYRWIAIHTTEQALTNKRVFRKTGLISRDTDELIVEKVETVAINQSVLGRIFDYGNIEFTGMGGIYIRLIYVPNPTLVKKNFNY